MSQGAHGFSSAGGKLNSTVMPLGSPTLHVLSRINGLLAMKVPQVHDHLHRVHDQFLQLVLTIGGCLIPAGELAVDDGELFAYPAMVASRPRSAHSSAVPPPLAN